VSRACTLYADPVTCAANNAQWLAGQSWQGFLVGLR